MNSINSPILIMFCICLVGVIPSIGQETNISPTVSRKDYDLISGKTDHQRKLKQLYRLNSLSRIKKTLYRDATTEELELLKIESADIEKYRTFYDKSDSGIIKLISDLDCGNPLKGINASDDCIKYSMPGNGSSYSFRERKYRMQHLSDLRYKSGLLKVGSKFTFGILGDLGNLEIDQISLDSSGVKQLRKLDLPKKSGELKTQYKVFRSGVGIDNHYFSNQLPIKVNSTYILRSVAFRTKSIVFIRGVTFNEFKYDKRTDAIVAFKVIRVDKNGAITIIWRLLQNKKSPKLEIG